MKKCKFLTAAVFILINTSLVVGSKYNNDSTQNQLPEYFKCTLKAPILTLSSGVNVQIEDASTINTAIPFNTFFMETITEFVRERIPERVVHAKGIGAFGYFEVTKDLSDICTAEVFDSVGKITKTVVRLSPANERIGGRDTVRDIRGFAIKFYTKEGNLDLLSLNLEMFSIKDTTFFPALSRIFHRNPKTHVLDQNMIWDFLTLRPETLHAFMRVFGDRGIPNGYRHMPAFPIHTFEMINKYGDRTYVKFHILPDAGIKNLTSQEAQRIQSCDTDFANRDLYNAIENGNYPSWTLYIQTIPYYNILNVGFDIFDVTRTWPITRFPLRPVGKLVLNEIPDNQFKSIELAVFNPAHLVNGIRGVDSVFEGRLIAYRDAQNYRLGTNFNKIKVNCPLKEANTYQRDGLPPVLDNGGDGPNIFPNSFKGPLPVPQETPPRLRVYTDPNPTNFDQASELYEEMSDEEKNRFEETVITGLSKTTPTIQRRALYWYKQINDVLAERLEYGLEYFKPPYCPQF